MARRFDRALVFTVLLSVVAAASASAHDAVKAIVRLSNGEAQSGRPCVVRKEDAPVAVDGSGEEYSLLEQVADGRAGANPERDLMRRELGTKISAALERLTPRERMVFELKHYHGLRLRTVGEMLNTTEETAKNTLFRATQKLRSALAEMR